MKKVTLIAALLLTLSSYLVNATVLTVSNSPLSGGQYTDIQSAISAAQLDDTVYVCGSPITYPNATINKRLTLIGAGYAPTGTQYNMPTVIGTLYIDSILSFGFPMAGIHIIGISGAIQGSTSYRFDNIHIERCYCTINYVWSEGSIIENCIIQSMYTYSQATVANRIIRNNFIIGDINWSQVVAAPGLIIDHNIIEGHIYSTSFAVITNNVFFFSDITASTNNNFNTYGNNITVSGSPQVLPFGNNSGSGNFNNVLPSAVFVTTNLIAAQTYPTLLNYNWRLLTTSVGHNAATDGTDIGIYGGAMPMPNFTGASTLPQMTMMNINNASIPLNGTLNYEFKARKQN